VLRFACLLFACAGSAAADDVTLALRADAWIRRSPVRLVDVADVQTVSPALRQSLEQLQIGRAPLAGQSDRRSKLEIEIAVQSQAAAQGHRFTWEGAGNCRLHAISQQVDGEELANFARAHLQSTLAARYGEVEVHVARVPADIAVAPGEIHITPRPVPSVVMRPRMAVWLDVSAGDQTRQVLVPLEVKAVRQVLVAQRALPAGAAVSAQDFVMKAEDTAGLPDAISGMPAAGLRLRIALEPGQLLSESMLSKPGQILKGDHLHLLVGQGAVHVDAAAISLGEAMPGQSVLVRLEQSAQTVKAKVVGPATVRMEEG